MKRKSRSRNYPALFVPEQRENENYDSPEKSTQRRKTTKSKYDIRIFGNARKTKEA